MFEININVSSKSLLADSLDPVYPVVSVLLLKPLDRGLALGLVQIANGHLGVFLMTEKLMIINWLEN